MGKLFLKKYYTKSGFLHFILGLTALISNIICALSDNVSNYYANITLLPLIYFLLNFVIYIISRNSNKSGLITTYVFLLVQWLRVVLLPMIGSVSGYFSTLGSYISEKAASSAVSMIIYELIVTSVICIVCLYYSGNKHVIEHNDIQLSGNRYIYIFFVFIAAAMFIVQGANMYQFFLIDLDNTRLSMQKGNEGSAVEAIISYGLSILIVLLLYYCYKKYTNTKKVKFVYTALIISLFRICLISSEGRMSIIYIFGTFLILLPQLFCDYRKRLVRWIAIVGVSVLAFMTIYKVFYAFLYESYLDALVSHTFELEDIASQIDVYFYGVKTIGRNLSYCYNAEADIMQPLIDIFKNTFGAHYFLRENLSTVQYYNQYLYGGQATSGHLFSSLAYGYLYFGAILAPLCTGFNLVLSFVMEKFMNKVKKFDILYFFCIIFVRVLLSMFSNFPQTWNVVSRTIILSLAVIGGASLFKKQKVY